MKTFTVIYAEDVPHYALGEIEARRPKEAVGKARKLDTDTFTAYDPDWSGAVSRRIVSIENPDGRTVAHDIRSTITSSTMPIPTSALSSTPPRQGSRPCARRRWRNSILKHPSARDT